MTTKIKRIAELMLAFGLILTGSEAFAQTEIPFPNNPYSTQQGVRYLNANGCDEKVYARMYNKAMQDYNNKAPAIAQALVINQVKASPQKATNDMLKCVESASNKFNSIGDKAKGIYDKIAGLGGLDIGKIGKEAADELSKKACSTFDTYTGSVVSNKLGTYDSAVTNIPGNIYSEINDKGTIRTKYGNVNVGGEVVNQVRNIPPQKKPNWWN